MEITRHPFTTRTRRNALPLTSFQSVLYMLNNAWDGVYYLEFENNKAIVATVPPDDQH